MSKKLVIGTRGSDLALWQAHYLQACLKDKGIDSQLHIVKTRGDKDLRPLKEIAGDGFFTKDLENRLLNDEIDIAIHSAKDLASMQHIAIPWKALGPREETDDVLICKKSFYLENPELKGAKIGTSSPRRRAQIKHSFPEAQCEELRGNVPTRLGKVQSGDFDVVVLAKAGLRRLKLLPEENSELHWFSPNWVTAPCQGILAVQAKESVLDQISSVLDEELTEIALLEKSILAFLGGGCHMAVGAKITKKENDEYELQFALEKEQNFYQLNQSYTDISQLRLNIYSDIHQCLNSGNLDAKKSLVLTHSLSNQLKCMDLCKSKNILAKSLPLIEISSSLQSDEAKNFIEALNEKSSLVFTSQYAVRIFMMELYNLGFESSRLENTKIYCIGEATKSKTREFGLKPQELQWDANANSFVEFINENSEDFQEICFVGSSDSLFLRGLAKNNISYKALFVYANKSSSVLGESIDLAPSDSISFASPSSVRAFIGAYGKAPLHSLKVYSIGPSTSEILKELDIDHNPSEVSGSWEHLISQIAGEK